jgi:hypothetical protein
MKRLASVFTLLCFLFLAANVAPVHATPMPPDTWLSLRSRNFFLIGNASDREMRRVALRLEQFRYVFSQLAPREFRFSCADDRSRLPQRFIISSL